MSESTLPVKIVVTADEASVGIAFSKLEAKAAEAGRKIGASSMVGKDWMPLNLTEKYKELDQFTYKVNRVAQDASQQWKLQQTRDVQTWQESVKAFQQAEQAKATAAKQAANERVKIESIQQSRDVQTWQESVKAFQQAEQAKATAAKQAANEMSRIKEIQQKRDYELWKNSASSQQAQSPFQMSGIRSPESVAKELSYLRESKKLWEALGPATEGYKGAIEGIDRKMNILTEGNARARGGFHKLAASIASMTFELTGALYGITAVGGAIAGGAIFGIKFLKDIEDAKMGISGTVLSMNLLTKGSMTTAEAMSVADGVIANLEQQSLKYNVSLADTAKLFQAIVGPGTAARMTMDEIAKTAVIGAVAVKSMGLNSMQVVQEVRDLVQGGIQAASSTLATALGLKDSDIKKAKESAQGLFAFLEERMAGFAMMSMERNNTLSGAWDMLWMKVQRLFADPAVFSALVDGIKQISDAIATIEVDEQGNFKGLKFNESLVDGVKQYLGFMEKLVTALGYLGEAVITVGGVISTFFGPAVAILIGRVWGESLLKILTSTVSLTGATVGLAEAHVAAAQAAGVYGARATTAIGAVAIASRSTATSVLSMVGKGGLVGLAVWGVVELSMVVFDRMFHSLEDRVAKYTMSLKRAGITSLKERREDLQEEYKSLNTGTASSLWNSARLKAIDEELQAVNRLIPAKEKQMEQERKINEQSAIIQQGTLASNKSQEVYEKSNPAAKRIKAESDANSILQQELMGVGEAYKRAEATRQAAFGKGELSVAENEAQAMKNAAAETDGAAKATRNYNQAMEDAGKAINKANARDVNKAARDAAKEQRELLKQTLEEYKARSAALDEQLATDLVSYSEWYDKKAALIEKSKVGGLDEDKAAKAMSELRIKLAKDATAAMKDIDAATAKYADTLSDGARYEKDFLDATKNKVDIMELELSMLDKTGMQTEAQTLRMFQLVESLDAYKKAAVEVTTVISPMLDAMQKIDQLKNVSDIKIEAMKQQPLDMVVGGPQELTPIEQSGIDLAVYENRNQLLREANAELEKMILLGAANADKTSETGKKFEEALKKVAGIRKEVEGYAKAINLSKTYGDQFYNTFSKAGILFGKLGKSIADVAKGVGNLVGASKTYEMSMASVANLQKDNPKYIKVEEAARKKLNEESIEGYANIAGAAKTMFEENSTGYKMMEAVEKGFRIYQLLMNAQVVAAQIGGLFAVQAATVASVPVALAADAVKGASAAAVGVATQAQGDPYSAWARMAAMVAVMAALGFAVGGGGGGSAPAIPQEATAEYQQSIQGTGTVLGDSTTQSETIANGIEILSQHSFEMLDYTQGMLNALKRIDSGISNLASSLAKIGGITGIGGVSAFGTVESTSSDPGFFGIGASTSSTDIINTGIYIEGTVDALTKLTGTISQFETTATSWSDSGFFGFGAESGVDINTQTKSITGEAVTQIGMIFGSMSDSIREGIDLLGMAANSSEIESLMTAVGNVPIDLTASLQGLSGEDITNALNGVFSAAFDNMVSAIMPYASDFQQIGEGVGETFIRLASDARTAELALKSMGMSFPDVTEYSITNAPTEADLANVVAAQTTRDLALANLQASQAIDKAKSPSVGEWSGKWTDAMLEQLMSGATVVYDVGEAVVVASQQTIDANNELIAADKALAAAHLAAGDTTLDMSHKLTIAREYLIEGAGGIDAFVDSAQYFADNFLTEAERLKPVEDALMEAFSDMSIADEATGHLAGLGLQLETLGYSVPKTTEQFVDIVKSLDLTTTSGADLYNSLMAVAPAFDAVAEATSAFIDQLRADASSFADAMSSYRGDSMIPVHQAELDAAFTTLNKIAPWITSVKQLSTMTSEDFSNYSEEARAAILETMQAADVLKNDYTAASEAASEQVTQAADEAASAYKEAITLQQAYFQGLVDFGKSVKDFLDQLEVSPETAVSPQSQLDAARSQYLEDLSKAKAGDYEAAQDLTNTAQTYIDVATSFYGKGSEQSAILSQIKAELGALNPVEQYDANLSALKELDARLETLDSSTSTINTSINNIGTQITTAVEVSTDILAKAYAYGLGRDSGAVITYNPLVQSYIEPDRYAPSLADSTNTTTSNTMSDWLKNRYASHGVTVPQFASGGDFAGGVRLVGEYGPELEITGPSRIYNSDQTRNLLTNSNNSANEDILLELQMLRAELAETKITLARRLEQGNSKISEQTQELSNVMYSTSNNVISSATNTALLKETA